MSLAAETSNAQAEKVFICYRRQETAAYAGRLYDAMVARFGDANVFMDVDIAPGADFEKQITEVVSGCVVLLVVIGPRWAEATEEDGGRRIDNPADFVRLEVETGLQRPEVRAIPVLVGGARMPRREDLPESIRAIARRNAIEMSDGRWSYDVQRLVASLDGLLPGAGNPPRATPAPPAQAASGWRPALEGAAVAGAAGLVGRWLAEGLLEFEEAFDGESNGETIRHIWTELARRTGTWVLVGAALAIWLALRAVKLPPARLAARGALIGALAGLLGGLFWTLLVYIPDPKAEFGERASLEIVSLAISGGLVGALIGSIWRPPRRAAAFGAGAVAGMAFAAFALAVTWKTKTPGDRVWFSGLVAALIAGSTLATMLALDRKEGRERGAAPGSG